MALPTVDYVFGEVRIGHNEACLQAIITSDGGQSITERGVVYSLSSVNTTPAIGGVGVTKLVAAGTGLGFYRNLLSSIGGNYTFRYYATNASGTAYHGSYSSFGTASPPGGAPQLFDATCAGASASTATLAALLGLEGAGPITSVGFVFAPTADNPAPTIGGSGVTQVTTTGGRGPLSMAITGLLPGTTYSFAAFAVGSSTAYSAVGTFATSQVSSGFYTQKIISRVPGPWSNPPCIQVLAVPSVDTDSGGWDTMRETLLVPYTPFFKAGERRDHMLDPRAQPFARMVAQFERTVGSFGGYPIVELTSLGLAREKPWKCVNTGDTQGTIGSGVTRNLPTVTCFWFSTELEGTKLIVPFPAVPPETFGWAALSGNSGGGQGWYIIKRDVDPLPVITGTWPPLELAATIGGNTTRTSANLNPRPTLCGVIDYYVYDPLTTVPPYD